MTQMANPIGILTDLEEKLGRGLPTESCESDRNYKKFFQEFPGGRRFVYAKVGVNEVQAISIFGREQPFNGIERYSVGYAVRKNWRGNRLSISAVNHGIKELRVILKKEGLDKFFLEAMIDEKNIPSIKIAEKIFSQYPSQTTDDESGTPSKLFYMLIKI